MQRRAFLTGIGVATTGAIPAVAAAPAATQVATVNTYLTRVAPNFNDRQPPSHGDVVRLRPDTADRYDPHAVAVSDRDGILLGYLPPIHGRMIGPLLVGGFAAEGIITSRPTSSRPAIRIAVTLHAAG
jgi:hypothetical protein